MAKGTPFTITNCNIISLDKEEKIGKGNKPYLLFLFKVDHPKAQGKEFAKFCFTSKPDDWPRVGKIISMTGQMEESGQYTNYTVSKILYDQTSKPPPAEEDPFGEEPAKQLDAPSKAPSTMFSEGIGKECSVCTSYAMELAKAMIANGFNGSQVDESLPMMCDAVGTQGFHLYLHLKAYMEKERAIK